MASTHKQLIERLKALRKIHSLTQEEFAERSGISYKYYQAVEGGRKVDLRLSTIIKLAAGLGIEVWELFGPDDPQPSLEAKGSGAKRISRRRKD